jgi:hypothetical protein
VLLSAIRRHAWTFAGSGSSGRGRPPVRADIRHNPLCRDLQAETPACDFYAATFERLFQLVLVHPGLAGGGRCVACEACGDGECRFEIRWSPVVLPELFRCQALDQDILVLAGARGQARAALKPAAAQYVARLQALDDTAPVLLVAHAYVRYLGDLNGGQALRRVVARALGLQGGTGTTFYDFGDDARRRQLIERFRDGLARVAEQTPDVDAIVAEAVSAFERHEALFDQLAPSA